MILWFGGALTLAPWGSTSFIWKSITSLPDSVTVAFAGSETSPAIRQSSSITFPLPSAGDPTATVSAVASANSTFVTSMV